MEDENYLLTTIGNQKYPISVSLNKFNGVNTIDIRRYYLERKTKKFKPTRKGIMLSDKTYFILQSALKKYNEDITRWLEADSQVPNETTAESEEQYLAVEKARIAPKKYTIRLDSWNSPDFFHTEERGGKSVLNYNSQHPFINKFREILQSQDENSHISEELQDELQKITDILLISFSRAVSLFENTAVMHPDILFDTLLFNWGILLRSYLESEGTK